MTAHALVKHTGSGPAPVEPTWQEEALAVIAQEPLFETRPSREALRLARPPGRPRAVLVGIGLCTDSEVSESLPLDVLGMLLPAEALRKAVGGDVVVALIADQHALSNNLHAPRVRRRAEATAELLVRLRERLGLQALQPVLASSFHFSREYQALLDQVADRAPDEEHAYFKKEVADVEYMHLLFGSVLKVGWTISSAKAHRPKHDEVAFDRRFRAWMGNHITFAYTSAGRALDDEQPKASPYLAVDPQTRLCLEPDEDVYAKLAWAKAAGSVSAQTIRGVRNHVKAVTRTYSQQIEPLKGPVEARVRRILQRIFPR